MTNQEILMIAMEQSAKDLCADASDFEREENVIVFSRENESARKYLKLPFSCQLVSYGNNVVASVLPEYKELTESYINKYPTEHLFETPNLQVLNDALGANMGTQGDLVIPVYIGQEKLDTIILNAQQRHALVSGGR